MHLNLLKACSPVARGIKCLFLASCAVTSCAANTPESLNVGDSVRRFGIETLDIANQDTPKPVLELIYRVRILGLPLGASSRIVVERRGTNYVAINQLRSPFAKNQHTSKYVKDGCNFAQSGCTNVGGALGWTFDDSVSFDHAAKSISYVGKDESLDFTFTDEVFVDKMSQYPVFECMLRGKQDVFFLHYVDNTIAEYEFKKVGYELIVVDGKETETVRVDASPVKAGKGTIHASVKYWLAPSLGYYPARIVTRFMGLKVSVKLKSFRKPGSGIPISEF